MTSRGAPTLAKGTNHSVLMMGELTPSPSKKTSGSPTLLTILSKCSPERDSEFDGNSSSVKMPLGVSTTLR